MSFHIGMTGRPNVLNLASTRFGTIRQEEGLVHIQQTEPSASKDLWDKLERVPHGNQSSGVLNGMERDFVQELMPKATNHERKKVYLLGQKSTPPHVHRMTFEWHDDNHRYAKINFTDNENRLHEFIPIGFGTNQKLVSLETRPVIKANLIVDTKTGQYVASQSYYETLGNKNRYIEDKFAVPSKILSYARSVLYGYTKNRYPDWKNTAQEPGSYIEITYTNGTVNRRHIVGTQW